MTGTQLPLPMGLSDDEPPPEKETAREPVQFTPGDDIIEAILTASADALPRLVEHIKEPQKVAKELVELIGPKARRPTLGGLWREKYTTKERLNALRMIQMLKQPVEVEPIISAIWDRDGLIRLAAVETLSRIGLRLDWSSPLVQHIIHALKIALRHHYADIRRASALTLAQLSAWEATEALADRLEVEKNDDVRQAVALALGSLSDASAVLPLLDSYESGEITAYVCLESLLTMGKRAVEPLISVVRRWNVRFISRQIAAEALGELGDPAAVESLVIILGRPHEPIEIRIAAATALHKLGDSSALPMLYWVRREWGLEASLRKVIDTAIPHIERNL